MNGPQIKDGKILREYRLNQIAESNQREVNNTEKRELIDHLIQNFVEGNRGIMGGTVTDDNEYVESIIRDVEEYGSGEKAVTTYDNLILSLVQIDKNVSSEQIERAFLQEVSKAFGNINSGSSGTKESHEELEKLINKYENELSKYYEIVNETSKELNLSISADYLKMLSSVRVNAAINQNLYITIAFVLFLIVSLC